MTRRFSTIFPNWQPPSDYEDEDIVTGHANIFADYRDISTARARAKISSVESMRFSDRYVVRSYGHPYANIDQHFYAPDADTIRGVAVIRTSEGRFHEVAATVSGISVIESAEITTFVDASKASAHGAVFQSVIDGDTVSGTAHPSSIDIFDSADVSVVVASAKASSGDERHYRFDSSTAFGTAHPLSATEGAQYLDGSTVSAIGIVTTSDEDTYIDSATISAIGEVLAEYEHMGERFVDSFDVSGMASLASDDAYDSIDFETVSAIGHPVTIEYLNTFDNDTIAAAGMILFIEGYEQKDFDTATAVGIASSVSYTEYVDTETITAIVSDLEDYSVEGQSGRTEGRAIGISESSAIETAQYVDANVSRGTSSPSAIEHKQNLDFDTVSGSASVSATSSAVFADTQVSSGVSVPSSTNNAHFTDASNVTPSGRGAALDAYIPIDAEWATAVARPSSTNLFNGRDAATATGDAVPSHIETHLDAITFVAATTAGAFDNLLTINVPTHATGDLLIAVVAKNASGVTITTPTGWTALAAPNGTNIGMSVFYKVAAASEPVNYDFVKGGSNLRLDGAMLAYRNADATAVAYVSNTNTGSSTSVVANSVTTTSVQNMVITIDVIKAATTFTAASSTTERVDTTSGGTVALEVSERRFRNAGATGTSTAVAGASASFVTYTMALRQ